MKIQYINPKPPKEYRYYTDLEEALRKMDVLVNEDPDVIVFGLAWFKGANSALLPNDKPTVAIVHKIEVEKEKKLEFLSGCDLVLSSVPKLPIKYKLFKYGVNPAVFNDKGMERIFDFGFTGALHNEEYYPKDTFAIPNFRKTIQELARTQTDLSLFLNGSDDFKDRIKSYEKYAELLSQSKIWLASTGPNGDIGPRYYEVQASKTLLFCDPPPKEYQRTFRDGQNCVYITPENFIEKLRYYLANDSERRRIVETAYRECMINHTWTARAFELLEICNAALQKVQRLRGIQREPSCQTEGT